MVEGASRAVRMRPDRAETCGGYNAYSKGVCSNGVIGGIRGAIGVARA